MKKSILIFVVASVFGASHAFAQTQATAGKGQGAVITETPGTSTNSSRGTITRAGKNEQSVYTPPAETGNTATDIPHQVSAAQTQQTKATTVKEEPAVASPR